MSLQGCARNFFWYLVVLGRVKGGGDYSRGGVFVVDVEIGSFPLLSSFSLLLVEVPVLVLVLALVLLVHLLAFPLPLACRVGFDLSPILRYLIVGKPYLFSGTYES